MGLSYMNINTNKVVSYEYKSKLSELTSKLMGIKKSMWNTDRAAHNKCKDSIGKFKQQKEIARYWIMQDPEVTPMRASEMCDVLLSNVENVYKFANDNHKELLHSVKQELEALKVMVSIDEHETSFFTQ